MTLWKIELLGRRRIQSSRKLSCAEKQWNIVSELWLQVWDVWDWFSNSCCISSNAEQQNSNHRKMFWGKFCTFILDEKHSTLQVITLTRIIWGQEIGEKYVTSLIEKQKPTGRTRVISERSSISVSVFQELLSDVQFVNLGQKTKKLIHNWFINDIFGIRDMWGKSSLLKCECLLLHPI